LDFYATFLQTFWISKQRFLANILDFYGMHLAVDPFGDFRGTLHLVLVVVGLEPI
jgi:hypothetical protein